MGLYTTPNRLYLSSRYQVWQLENALGDGEIYNGYDKLYVPRVAYTTGDLDIHDLAVNGAGRVIFVNTLYSCLAATSDRYSFTPVWQPPFIDKLAPEDRCHLNGLAMVNGQPRYVTAVSRSDVAGGWRERRHTGGCLVDTITNETILSNLSMPHSPRWYRGQLWLLESGTGDLGFVDLERGVFEAIAFCPGYVRGLTFYQDWALVGLSKPRGDRAFSGLPLDERLASKDAESRCGIAIVNLNTGNLEHWIQIEGIITELYDVQLLPGVQRPMALGFKTDEICHLISIDPQKLDIQGQASQALIREAREPGQIFPELDYQL